MNYRLLAITFIILASSCSKKPFEYERVDLNNHLIDIDVWENFNTFNQLKLDSIESPQILAVHEATLRTLTFITDLEELLITASGGYSENGSFANPETLEPIQEVIFDQKHGEKLKTELDNYSNFLSSYGLKNPRIAMDPPKHKVLRNDPYVHNSTFEQLHFNGSNLYESLNTLRMYKNKVLFKESMTINVILLNEKSL
jgi:hypothetical protein